MSDFNDRWIRVFGFFDFEGTIPNELQLYCDVCYIPLVIDIAPQCPIDSAGMCVTDTVRDVWRSNLKVCLAPTLQEDEALFRDLSLLFTRAGFAVSQPMSDRLVCVAPVPGLKYLTRLHAASLATSAAAAAAATALTTATTASSEDGSDTNPMGRLGDRWIPVDQAEHDANRGNPDLEIQRTERGLCIGPYVCLCDLECLRAYEITHTINASQRTSVVATRYGIKVLDIDVTDASSSNLLIHLPACRAFIDNALRAGGVVLVNCFAGVSRSASIVIDYWMYRDKLTFRQARDKLLTIRSCIKPNSGFRAQLRKQRMPNEKEKEQKKERRKHKDSSDSKPTIQQPQQQQTSSEQPALTQTDNGHDSNKARTWDDKHLFAYLQDPKKYVPATKVVFAGLKKPEERADFVAYLKSAGSTE